jgi:hypothetical protein
MVVKKRQRKRSMWVALGHREKRRRMGRGAVEDGQADAALTRVQKAAGR